MLIIQIPPIQECRNTLPFFFSPNTMYFTIIQIYYLHVLNKFLICLFLHPTQQSIELQVNRDRHQSNTHSKHLPKCQGILNCTNLFESHIALTMNYQHIRKDDKQTLGYQLRHLLNFQGNSNYTNLFESQIAPKIN